jgi:hypothetical protein
MHPVTISDSEPRGALPSRPARRATRPRITRPFPSKTHPARLSQRKFPCIRAAPRRSIPAVTSAASRRASPAPPAPSKNTASSLLVPPSSSSATATASELLPHGPKKNDERKVYSIIEKNEDAIKINESIAGDECFITGSRVNDFHTLDKNDIYTLNVCATQELYKIIQKQETIINDIWNPIHLYRIGQNHMYRYVPVHTSTYWYIPVQDFLKSTYSYVQVHTSNNL